MKKPRLDNALGYQIKLLRHDVAIQYSDQAWVYDRTRDVKPVRSTFSRLKSRWQRARADGPPLIADGLKWRSVAQIIGGFNLFLPSFSTMLLTSLLFFGLAVYLHGVTSAIALGWIALIASLAVFVVLRLRFMRAPVLAYAALPSLPFILFWQSFRSCFAAKPKKPQVSPQPETKNEGRVQQGRRPRRRYSRRPRRQQPS